MIYENETSSMPGDPPDTLSDVNADKKKKNIDEMIEEFNRNNPAKKTKKIYRGTF